MWQNESEGNSSVRFRRWLLKSPFPIRFQHCKWQEVYHFLLGANHFCNGVEWGHMLQQSHKPTHTRHTEMKKLVIIGNTYCAKPLQPEALIYNLWNQKMHSFPYASNHTCTRHLLDVGTILMDFTFKWETSCHSTVWTLSWNRISRSCLLHSVTWGFASRVLLCFWLILCKCFLFFLLDLKSLVNRFQTVMSESSELHFVKDNIFISYVPWQHRTFLWEREKSRWLS